MLWLAKEKRRLSASTGSAVLRADAAESALCACLSVIALAGLAVNAIWRVAWADPVAALAVVPLIIWEGRQAIRGKACGLLLGRKGKMKPRGRRGRERYILLADSPCRVSSRENNDYRTRTSSEAAIGHRLLHGTSAARA